MFLAYLILAIRRTQVDRRRPATYFIMSRNCARITPGGPIKPENFDSPAQAARAWRRCRYILTLPWLLWEILKNTFISVQTVPAATSSHHRHRRHEISMSLRLNSISPCLTCAGLLDSEHFACFTGSTWLARISSESSMLFNSWRKNVFEQADCSSMLHLLWPVSNIL